MSLCFRISCSPSFLYFRKFMLIRTELIAIKDSSSVAIYGNIYCPRINSRRLNSLKSNLFYWLLENPVSPSVLSRVTSEIILFEGEKPTLLDIVDS